MRSVGIHCYNKHHYLCQGGYIFSGKLGRYYGMSHSFLVCVCIFYIFKIAHLKDFAALMKIYTVSSLTSLI